MASRNLNDELNAQLNRELYASYLYLGMSGHFEARTYPGFASWMKRQSDEERTHAMKIWDFIFDRGEAVTLLALDQPPSRYGSVLDVFERALEQEKEVTEDINKLYGRALDERDYAAQAMLQWFVNEQVEEEKTLTDIVETLKRIGDSDLGLFALDRTLAGQQTPVRAE